MKYITKFRIYFSAITFILFSCLGIFLLKYFNPRNAETIEITANSYLANADVLSKIKIFRLTVNDEILEIAKDEKLNDSAFVFRSDKVFIKKILISLPDSLGSEPLSFQIKVGNKNFCFANQHISKSWLAFKPHNVNIDNPTKEELNLYEFPKEIKSVHSTIPFLINIINLPSYSFLSFFKIMGIFVLIYLIILYYRYLECKKNYIPLKISKPGRFILPMALLITVLIAFLTFRINEEYTSHNPYYLDPVANNLRFVKIYEQLKDSSKVEVILNQLNTNTINPFRSIPLILFAPFALIVKWGHAINTFLFLFVFLYLMAMFIYKRTENIIFSLGIMLFFVSAPVFFDGRDGLFPFWQDISAGLVLASAALCFLFWHNTKKLKWIILFSILISFCVMSRYNTFFYSIMLFAPVFLYSFYCNWKTKEDIVSTIIKPFLLVIVITSIICGYWLIKHFDYNFNYYSHADVFGNTGLSIKRCIIGLAGRILIYFEEIYLFVICIILALVFLFIRKNFKTDKENIFLLLWLIVIIPAYWIFILGLDAMKLGIVELVAYPLVFSCFVSIISINPKIKSKYLNYLAILIIVWSCFLITDSFNRKILEAKSPLSKTVLEDKELQLLFAEQIKKIKKNSQQNKFVFQNFIDRAELNYNLALETYYETGILPDNSHFLFSSEISFLEQNYPDIMLNYIGDSVYNKVSDELNFILVFEDPASPKISNSFNNEFNKSVASIVKTDPAWKKTGSLYTNKYSTVSFYYKPK